MAMQFFQTIMDWFAPNSEDGDPIRRQNHVVFATLHLLGPLVSFPLLAFVFANAASPYPHAYVLLACIMTTFTFPFVVRLKPHWMTAATLMCVQILTFSILYGAFNYGGVQSPLLIWLPSIPIAAFLILGSTSTSQAAVGSIVLVNLVAFFAISIVSPSAQPQVDADAMMTIAMISALLAVAFVFLISSYYGNVVQKKQELAMYLDKQRQKARRLKDAKDDALRANSAKSDFLANMSHELRTPLNAVLGYSEILLEDAELDGRSADIADLQKISAAGKHLLSMVNDILDLSKIEAGKAELFVETFDLERFVDEIDAIGRPLAAKNNNAFVLLKGADLGKGCMDITKVRQSVLNLMSNASKFTKNGQITLSIERRLVEDVDSVVIEVRDTGVGISEENLDNMFKNFSQANASITAQFGGTGLGLSLSQNLCRLMGGKITLQSVLNEGSTFTITLPAHLERQEVVPPQQGEAVDHTYSGLTEEARQITEESPVGSYHRSGAISQAADLRMKLAEMQKVQVAAAQEGRTTGKQSILVIDDDRNVLDVAERLLEREGYQPVCADSPESVLQLARTVKPCAIILDVVMPGLDGWDVIGTLKSDAVTAGIPVVMISNSLDREKVLRHKAVGYIEKPLSSEKLKLALDNVAKANAA